MSIDTIYIYGSRTENRTNDKRNQTNTETSWDILKHCETLWNIVKHANIVNIRKTPRLNLSAKETCDFLHPAHTLLDLRSSFDLFCLHVSGTNTIKMYAESCRTLNLVESHISNKRPNAFVSRRSPNDDHRPAAHSLAARVPHVFHPKLRCWSLHFTSCHFMSRVQKTQQLCNSISTDLCPLWHFNAPSICILVNSPIISNSRTCTSSHSSSFSRSIFHVPGPSRLFQWICFFRLSVSTFLEHSPVVLFDFMVSWSHLPSWRFLSIASLVKTKMQNQGFPPWFVALVPVV